MGAFFEALLAGLYSHSTSNPLHALAKHGRGIELFMVLEYVSLVAQTQGLGAVVGFIFKSPSLSAQGIPADLRIKLSLNLQFSSGLCILHLTCIQLLDYRQFSYKAYPGIFLPIMAFCKKSAHYSKFCPGNPLFYCRSLPFQPATPP